MEARSGGSGAGEDFAAFAAQAWPGVVRTAVLFTGDETAAEDLARAALVRVHRRWRSIRRHDRPEVDLHRVMVDLYGSWWRRRGRQWLVDEASAGSPAPLPVAVRERDQAVERALADLPPRTRVALVLRFSADLADHEIAKIVRCPIGTVEDEVSRGLAVLRTAMADRGDDSRDAPTLWSL